MKQITSNTVLIQNGKSYPAIQTEQGIVWVDPSLPIEEEYPKIVVEKLNTGDYMLWQIDNINDIDRSCQYQIIAANFELEGVPKIEFEDEVEKYIKNISEFGKPLRGDDAFKPHLNCGEIKELVRQGYKANQAKYTEEDIENAIELARELIDGKNSFEVENILGSSDGTYGIEIKYTFKQIIQLLNSIKEITAGEIWVDKDSIINAPNIELI